MQMLHVLAIKRARIVLGFAACLAAASISARAQTMDSGEHTVTVGGIQRSFVVHMPANLASPAPVVLVFHGYGGRPQRVALSSGMDDIADEHGFIAVYPLGAGANSGFRGAWNVGGSQSNNSRSAEPAVSSDDVAFVRALLEELDRITPIDHARIYATGLSMGGVFSYRLACEMSDTFAAVAPVAATMVQPSCRPRNPVAIIHIHGGADERIPLNGGRGANRTWPAPRIGVETWSRLDHCSGAPTRVNESSKTCTTYNNCDAPVEFCVIAGQPHGWPSDPGVSKQIWAFFAANPKRAN